MSILTRVGCACAAAALFPLLSSAGSPAPLHAQASASSGTSFAAIGTGPTRLLRKPTIGGQHIAFEYGNDIWIAARDGGDARRLTSFQGQETDPAISPDGRWVAFSAEYGGNTDVWVLPVEGGEPKRLTWHPGGDRVEGWTRDSRRVVFSSGRTNAPSGQKFWTVGLDGDFPQELPMPRADQGQFSPDGSRFAYRMVSPWDEEWRNYRGGQNRPIWILDMDDYDLEEVRPWDGSDDMDPVWVGQTVYFLSDRDWAMNIWSFDTRTKELAQVTHYTDFDVKTLDSDGQTLVYEYAGWIHTIDPQTGNSTRVDITVRGDFPWLMPHWEDVGNQLRGGQPSPNGVRAIFEARGDIFTVPAGEDGDWRNLTGTPGVAERTPAWSPDGTKVSWFSDESGEYQLVIANQDGRGDRTVIDIPEPTYFYTPAWSPDGSMLVFTDTDLRIWVAHVDEGRIESIDTDEWMVPTRSVDPQWSADSRYLTYAKRLDNLMHAVFVYSVEDGTVRQVTNQMADAYSPSFDASGKYLYFLAGTNTGLNSGWLDMVSYDRPSSQSVYMMLLRADEASPFLPELVDESAEAGRGGGQPDQQAAGGRGGRGGRAGGAGGGAAAAGAGQQAQAPDVVIDYEGLDDRILELNLPNGQYGNLRAGVAGQFFFTSGGTIRRYSVEDEEAIDFASGGQYALSPDRTKILYRAGGGGGGRGGRGGGRGGGAGASWVIADSNRGAPSGTAGQLNVTGVRMRIEPRAEFQQMFDEGWRFQRDYLYVPNMHGVDYERTKAMYAPMVEHVAHRSDLNYLLDWMGGEVAVGHSFVRGGDTPSTDNVAVGLLGADLEIANGRYRIAKIYRGGPWDGSRGPLGSPGLKVSEGDYILAVDDVELRAPENPYRLFENKSNRQVLLRVASNANGADAHDVVVVPTGNEGGLRRTEWINENQRKVDELSGGRLAYVWLPNTGQGGYGNFNRYYFAQQDKEGAVIDERFNSGGSAADYIIEFMMREPHGYFNNPVGDRKPFTSPAAGIWGPKVMIVNEMAGSGGDLMPYMFHYYGVGPLVGMRTWGGLVGTWDTPPLLDGGSMIAPRGGFFDINGEWAVENEGTPPDIQVEMTPKEVIAGRDPQLERAVQEALRLLENGGKFERMAEPPFPIRSRRPGGGTGNTSGGSGGGSGGGGGG